MTKTYAQLTREIQALQASAEKLRATEVKAAIAKINESIAHYELTADDLHFPSTNSASTRHPQVSSSGSSRSTASKYSDGQGNTWGGRGPRPAWLRNAISGGRSLESFETSSQSVSSSSSQPERNGDRQSKAMGTVAKAKLPAMYGHPKTGQTWSGRGPKPAWLKQSLKKRGASIDDFLISARAATPAEETKATPTAAPAPNQSVRARAKPTAPQRPAAPGKSLAEKVGTRTKTSPAPTPDTAVKTPAPAPVKAATKTKTASAANTPAAAPSASAKKTVSKAPAKRAVKPAPKSAGAPRKNLPSSMAPSPDAAPAPSTVPAAAPMPAPQSDSVEGRGDVVRT
jgi:DNA-binding protein H-NS